MELAIQGEGSTIGRDTSWRILYAIAVLPDDPCISHLNLAARAFAGLIAYGPNVQVGVVLTGERALHYKDEQWLLTDEHCQIIKKRLFEAVPEADRHRLHLYFGPEHIDQASIENCCRWIEDFRPDIVYCWLGIFETRILRPWLFQRYPLNTIQFSGENFHPGLCDGIVTISPLVKLNCSNEVVQKFIPGPFITHSDYFMAPARSHDITCDVLTPMQGLRLSRAIKSYSGERSRTLTDLFKRLAATWRLLGEEDYAGLLQHNPYFEQLKQDGLLQCKDFDLNLQDTLCHCKLLFYPPDTIGGGGSSFNAIISGVPVLAPNTSDSANFISQEHLYSNDEDMLSKLEEILCNEDFRHELVRQQQEYLLLHNTLDAYAHNLLVFARDAQVNFQKRQLCEP
ncbi:MAG: glycosyltransferase family 1 protein [Desulfuromonadaceae bacterium]|nr:glycosyltransferase family 1 protein [Desulfuromonadaceae bacterium]